jgi:hypothetical protein
MFDGNALVSLTLIGLPETGLTHFLSFSWDIFLPNDALSLFGFPSFITNILIVECRKTKQTNEKEK